MKPSRITDYSFSSQHLPGKRNIEQDKQTQSKHTQQLRQKLEEEYKGDDDVPPSPYVQSSKIKNASRQNDAMITDAQYQQFRANKLLEDQVISQASSREVRFASHSHDKAQNEYQGIQRQHRNLQQDLMQQRSMLDNPTSRNVKQKYMHMGNAQHSNQSMYQPSQIPVQQFQDDIYDPPQRYDNCDNQYVVGGNISGQQNFVPPSSFGNSFARDIHSSQKPQLQQQIQQYQGLSQQISQLSLNHSQDRVKEIINKLAQGSEHDKSLAKILTHIHEGSQKISTDDKSVVLVMGNTGAGKTSLTAHLSGLDLVIKKTKYDEPYVDYLKREEWHGKIGTSNVDSETFIPNKFVSADGVVFWDCPGFADSRGSEIDIANSFYIGSIAKNAERVKFVLVIDGSSFHNKGFGDLRAEAYKLLFETINHMSKGTKIDFSQNLTLIFTKTKEKKGVEFYHAKLGDLFDELIKSDGYGEKIKKFFKIHDFSNFFEAIKRANVVTFSLPKGEIGQLVDIKMREAILATISKSNYYNRNDINMPASIRSLEKVQSLWEYTRSKIQSTFELICTELSKGVASLNANGLNQVNKIVDTFDQKYKANPPRSNSQYLEYLKKLLIDPYFNIIGDKKYSDNIGLVNKNKINDNIAIMDFFGAEVYDGLLSKVYLSEEANKFFGKMGDVELHQGLSVLRDSYNDAVTYVNHQAAIQQKDAVVQKTQNLLSEERKKVKRRDEELKRRDADQRGAVSHAVREQQGKSQDTGSNFTTANKVGTGAGAAVGGAGGAWVGASYGARFGAFAGPIGAAVGAVVGAGVGYAASDCEVF